MDPNVENGTTVYVCTSALSVFAKKYLPYLTNPIVLVSGDGDESISLSKDVPLDGVIMASSVPFHITTAILESPLIIKWFAQNCMMTHSKLVKMPIGLDYHSAGNYRNNETPFEQEELLMEIAQSAVSFDKRKVRIHSSFYLPLSGKAPDRSNRYACNRADRKIAFRDIPKELIDHEPTGVDRKELWKKQIEYAFIASPFGNGPDCHRTWEALILGCIPIVLSSEMDSLFDDLPVLLVKKWSDVTEELLHQTIKEYKEKEFNVEKLTLEYWVKRFKI
jgi:hypothetical protein